MSARLHRPSESFGLRLLVALFLLAPAVPNGLAAEEASGLREAFAAGEVQLDLRYRLEHVDDDIAPQDALASTLRSALGFSTARWRGFQVVLEAENVTVLGDDEGYRNAGAGSLSNGVTDRAVVADPEITEVNQAFLDWESDGVSVRAGRQEIDLGDQRFVGAVGWRQNHQSFDAVRADVELGPRAGLTVAWLETAHRIFGDAVALEAPLVWAPVDVGRVGTLTGYGLFLDFPDSPERSSRTVGVELAGSADLASAARLTWELDLAEQRDHGDRISTLDAGYLHASFGVVLGGVGWSGGLEVLEGEAGSGAFSTPLATLHKFNGWADRFLATPPDGLEDLSLSARGTAGPVGWTVVVHRFEAESTSAEYGRELDALFTWTAPADVSWGLKAALYDAEDFSSDVTKVMLWASTKL